MADYGYELEDPDYVPLVSYAIYVNTSLEMIELLMDHGLDIMHVNADGVGVIDVAIKHKRADIVQLCIDSGIDPSVSRRKSGITPLILAASFNDVNMVKYLVDQGVDINQADNFGLKAEDYAKKMDQKAILEYIKSKSQSDMST